MQFQVPQFIEVEDKIFGPLTFKQFIFLAGGAGMAYLAWRILPFFFAVPIALGVGALTLALAFFTYNGRPFLFALETGFYYIIHSKLYLWNNNTHKKAAPKMTVARTSEAVYIPHLSDSKLHDLAWSLDIKERLSAGVGSEDDRETRNALAPVRTPGEIIERLKR